MTCDTCVAGGLPGVNPAHVHPDLAIEGVPNWSYSTDTEGASSAMCRLCGIWFDLVTRRVAFGLHMSSHFNYDSPPKDTEENGNMPEANGPSPAKSPKPTTPKSTAPKAPKTPKAAKPAAPKEHAPRSRVMWNQVEDGNVPVVYYVPENTRAQYASLRGKLVFADSLRTAWEKAHAADKIPRSKLPEGVKLVQRSRAFPEAVAKQIVKYEENGGNFDEFVQHTLEACLKQVA